MAVNPDFRDLFSALCNAGAELLAVGAHAVMFHTSVPRYTKGLDVWVKPSKENAPRVLAALDEFGAPTSDLSADDLSVEGTIFQIGVAPNRIDVITSIEGVSFAAAEPRAVSSTYGGLPIRLLGIDDLLVNKRTVGRKQDLVDVESLEAALRDKRLLIPRPAQRMCYGSFVGRRVLALAVAALVAGCAVKSLDVGSDDHPAVAGEGGVAAEAGADAATLLETLTARCAAAEGPPDPFTSAADLAKHLEGRWYMCPAPQSKWVDDPPQGLELHFATTVGSWGFLKLDEAGTFAASDNPNETGGILFLVPAGAPGDAGRGDGGPDGGGATDGGSPMPVPVDDTTPLFGFTIELERAALTDFFFIPSFEKAAHRRMTLSELGNDPANAIFVPID